PLFGTGAGNLKPTDVAKIYSELFNDLNSPKFIVSVPNVFSFDEIKSGFEMTTDKKDRPEIVSRLHSDIHSLKETDVLNYDLIAENLFTILADDHTSPPLNIGIIAPWGRGKTSLMRRLQSKFDSAREDLQSKIHIENPNGRKRINIFRKRNFKIPKISIVKKWLKIDGLGVKHNIPYSTVWFNPWNYQSTEMIWAGLANSIIDQVVKQIPSKFDQEIFWFQLRIARVNKEKLRLDIQIRWALHVIKFAIWILVLLVSFVIFWWFNNYSQALIFASIGSTVGLITSLASKIKPYNKSIMDAFDKYSKPPKYEKKLGTFHEVQLDINRVLDLCIDEAKPLVVFVDDLDRCSPGKVVEVIEAINVFINGKYNNKCYFILGMDAEMVASALDVSYEKLKGKLGQKEIEQGSIGWYFLDKFIQLPFFIPIMSDEKKKEYIEVLLTEKNEKQEDELKIETNKTTVDDLYKNVMHTSNNLESAKLISEANLTSVEMHTLEKMILNNQVKSQKQNLEIQREVVRYAPFINPDPRSLKRFTNLLRFYCSYQFLRMKKNQDYVDAKVLSKWLTLMIKFPQFIRWLQWGSDKRLDLNLSAERKADLIDNLVQKASIKSSFVEWLKNPLPIDMQNDGKQKTINDLEEIPWLKSEGMFEILLFERSEKANLRNALNCGVW
ncbi:MAG: KAP family P-loop NTPase fold protein, partial [Ginsengibacter sp.]